MNYKFNSAYFGNGLGYGSEKPVLGLPAGGFINNRLGVYVHDTWRVSRTFTVNGGLRYDLDTGLTNHDLLRTPGIGAFDPELGGYPRNDNLRLGPQAGFSWNIKGDGKTIIRGGGGIYYETNIFNNILFDRTVNLPPGLGNATPLVGVAAGCRAVSDQSDRRVKPVQSRDRLYWRAARQQHAEQLHRRVGWRSNPVCARSAESVYRRERAAGGQLATSGRWAAV